MNSWISCDFVFSRKQIIQIKTKLANEFEKETNLKVDLEEIILDEVFLSLNKPMTNTINCIVEAHFKDNEDYRHTKRISLVLPCNNGKPDGRRLCILSKL